MTLRRRAARALLQLLGVRPEDLVQNPCRLALQVDDAPERVYAWLMPGATEQDRDGFAEQLASTFRAHYGRDPRATHLVLNDVHDALQLTPRQVRLYLKPWMKES